MVGKMPGLAPLVFDAEIERQIDHDKNRRPDLFRVPLRFPRPVHDFFTCSLHAVAGAKEAEEWVLW